MDNNQNNYYVTETKLEIDTSLIMLIIGFISFVVGFVGMLTIHSEFDTQRIFNPITGGFIICAMIVFSVYYILFLCKRKVTILVPVFLFILAITSVLSMVSLFALQYEYSVEFASIYTYASVMGDANQFFWSSIMPELINPIIYVVFFTTLACMCFTYKLNKKFLCFSFIFVFAQAPLELTSLFSTIALNIQGSAFAFAFALGQYLFFVSVFLHLYHTLNDFKKAPNANAPVSVPQADTNDVNYKEESKPTFEAKPTETITEAKGACATNTLKERLESVEGAFKQELITEEEYNYARSEIIKSFIS